MKRNRPSLRVFKLIGPACKPCALSKLRFDREDFLLAMANVAATELRDEEWEYDYEYKGAFAYTPLDKCPLRHCDIHAFPPTAVLPYSFPNQDENDPGVKMS